MVKIEEIQKKIQMHSLWLKEIPVGFQLGLPILSIQCNRLCISFLIYRTVPASFGLELFPPRYFATWMYPFDKVVRFLDLAFQKTYFVMEPVRLEINEPVIERYNMIYTECEKAIDAWLTEHKDETICNYQDFFISTVEELKLDMYDRRKLNVLYSSI